MTSSLRFTVVRVALVIASAVAGASCAGGGESVGVSSAAIIGGDADVSDTAVVALENVSNGSLCSGTLIAPSLVLTAAHCVDGIAASDLRVLVGSDISSPDQTVVVASVASYPTYDGESDGIPGGVDLGVLTLAGPLSITPIPLATTTTDAALTGAEVTVIGFGATDGTDNSGSGTRRAVVLSVTTVCSRVIAAGDATTNACVGDSGGAVLLAGKLVAVVSGGHEGCAAPTSFMRTDAHAEWLAAVLAGNVAASCSACVEPDPSCTAATETRPAGAAVDAGDDGSDPEAGGSAPSATRGGCGVGRGGTGTSGGLPGAFALLVGLVGSGRRWSRRRR